MAIFNVAYRIVYNDTYFERYGSLIDTINRLMSPRWHHTTSLVIGRSESNTADLASQLFYNTDISSEDHVLVINLDERVFTYHGAEPEDLQTLRRLFRQLS